jgi:hypothetical protein
MQDSLPVRLAIVRSVKNPVLGQRDEGVCLVHSMRYVRKNAFNVQ